MSAEVLARRLRLAFLILGVTLAATLAARGLSYIGPASPDRVPASLAALHSLMPLGAWAVLLFGVAGLIVAGVWNRRIWIAGLIAYAVLQAAWISSFMTATFTGIAPRGWLSAVNYLPELVLALVLIALGPPPVRRRDD